MESINSFLLNSHNSIIREDLANSIFISELKQEALYYRRKIKIYQPEIDLEGFDLIVEDDCDLSRKFQLKTVLPESKRKYFEIHNSMLLPNVYNANNYGFDNHLGNSQMGCVLKIILTFDESKRKVIPQYEYTDLNIISFFAIALKKKTAENLLKKIYQKPKKVNISTSLFISLYNIQSLFKVVGFFDNYEFNNTCLRFNQLYRGNIESENRNTEFMFITQEINRMIQKFNRPNN